MLSLKGLRRDLLIDGFIIIGLYLLYIPDRVKISSAAAVAVVGEVKGRRKDDDNSLYQLYVCKKARRECA